MSIIKVKTYRGIYVSRITDDINRIFCTTNKPDHTALKKESEEFITYIKEKRAMKNKETYN